MESTAEILEPVEGETHVVTWDKGRHGGVVTWQLGKLGILARETRNYPNIGETWSVQIIRDTQPGTRGGVYVLLPLERQGDHIPSNNVEVIEAARVLVYNVVSSICGGTTQVEVSQTDQYVRYLVQSDGDSKWLLGQGGEGIRALRTIVALMLRRVSTRSWLDFGSPPPYAECSCGKRFADPTDFELHAEGPEETEERFESCRPTRYISRVCSCGAKIYVRD